MVVLKSLNSGRLFKQEIRSAIQLIVWPLGTSNFTINPTPHGNGVKPIKNACMAVLKETFGWQLNTKITYATKSPGRVDATKALNGHLFALEWETISSGRSQLCHNPYLS